RLGGGVRAGTGHDGDAAGRGLDHDLHHALVLVVAQRRRFAGGAARDDSIGAVGHVGLDQLAALGLVHLAVAKRGHQRDEGALKRGPHTSLLCRGSRAGTSRFVAAAMERRPVAAPIVHDCSTKLIITSRRVAYRTITARLPTPRWTAGSRAACARCRSP